MRALILFLLAGSLSSCAFNKLYYAPDKIDKRIRNVRLPMPGSNDTLLVYLNETHDVDRVQTASGADAGMTIKAVKATTPQGHHLYNWLVTPTGGKPKATIIFYHGNAGSVVAQFPLVIPFVQKGYRVMVADYSGYGLSDGKPTRRHIRADAATVLAAARQMPDVAGSPIILYGQSMGGQIAAGMAVQHPADADMLVIEGAPSSHKDVAGSMFPLLRLPARVLVRERFSTYRSVRRYTKPLLVVHSREDEVIPHWMGKKTYLNGNDPKKMLDITHKHLYGPVYHTDEILQKTDTLLSQ